MQNSQLTTEQIGPAAINSGGILTELAGESLAGQAEIFALPLPGK